MRLKRIIISILLAACVCICFCLPVYAETDAALSVVTVSPLYDIAKQTTSDLTIVGTKAECRSYALGNNVVMITVEQTLQKYSGWFWIWNNVDGASWSKTVNNSSLHLLNTKSGLTSGKYRLKSVFTLTDKNDKTETITIYSNEATVG